MTISRPSSLVIVPTFNEAANIEPLIDTLFSLYPGRIAVLVIDDGSPDGTAALVRGLQRRHAFLALIERERKLGLGTAYIRGFRYALEHGYERVVEMDADFSHDPALVGALLDQSGEADLVIGSRYVGGRVNVVNWPLSRLMLSKGASIYTRIITGMPIADPTSGFKCIQRAVLEAIDLDTIGSQGYSFQIEIHFRAWKKGFSIREIPITFTDRTVGQSKMTRKNIREAIWRVWWLKLHG